ncbi:MAG TPA: ribokinase, partial [Acidimicrobiales bacterium]|nr:ribokinase [Acidimicrobiales bacterium]
MGSANIDHVVQVPRLPAVGETIVAGGYFTAPGGKGLNQCVAAARQGASVSLIACVGADEAGDDLARLLAAEGIDRSGLRRTSESPTGLALVTVADGGANTVVAAPLANAHLTPADIDAAGAVIERASVLLIQLEIPPPVVEQSLRLARAAGVTTVLNPAPAPSNGFVDVDLGLVDVLVPNEIEATSLTGVPVEQAGSALVAAGSPTVVVTM